MFAKLYLAMIATVICLEIVKPIYGVYFLNLLFIVNPGQFFKEQFENYNLYFITAVILFVSALPRGFSINQAKQLRYMFTTAIFLFCTFISILFSGDVAKTAVLKTAQFSKVMFFSIILILFLKKREQLLQVLRYYVFGVALNGAFALYEQIFHPIRERIGVGGFYRSSGFTKNANDLGVLLVSGIPLAYYLYRHEKNKFMRFLGLAGFACAVVGVFCTVSRGSLVAMVFIISCIFIKNIRQITTIMIMVLIFVLFLSFAKNLYQQRETVTTTASGRTVIDASAGMRLKLAETAIGLWLQNPIFGVGPGKFEDEANAELHAGIHHGSTHNAYLQLLCEHGIVGLFIFVWFFVFCFKAVGVMKRVGGEHGELAGYLKINLLAWCVCSIFGSINATPYLWMCLAFPLVQEKIYLNEQEEALKPVKARGVRR